MLASRFMTVKIALLAFLIPSGVQARIFVLKSNVGTYPPRSVIESTDKIDIPNGKRLVVMTPDGRYRELTSSDNGPARNLLERVKPLPWWQGFLDMATSGGGKKERGFRDFGTEPAVSDERKVEIEGVSLDRGPFCLRVGHSPIITRVGNIDSKPLIINVAGSEGLHASLTFPEGKTKAYWPPSLSLNMTVGERAIYSLSFADGAAEKIEFVVIGTRGIDESDVLAFGNAGCLGQAADALNKLARTQNRRSFD